MEIVEKLFFGFAAILIIALIIMMVLFIVGFHFNTGNGQQVGYISAVEKSGVFYKTYRVYVKPTLESTQEDIYCVIDESIVEKLNDASVKKNNVKVTYFEYLFLGIKYCGSESAIVDSVTNI